MSIPRRLMLGIALCLLVNVPALAETVTWTMNDVPIYEDIAVDLGGTLNGIASITITAAGQSGDLVLAYDDPISGVVTYSMAWGLAISLSDATFYGELPMHNVAFTYEEDGYAQSMEFLNDGTATLFIDYVESQMPQPGSWTQSQIAPVVDTLTITVECDSAVAAEQSSFGAVKALYR